MTFLTRNTYSVIIYALIPLVLVRLALKSRKNTAYRKRISERFGFYSTSFKRSVGSVNGKGKKVMVLHAVSVGEAIAAKPLVKRLLVDYPDYDVVMTTSTPTGSAVVQSFSFERLHHVYFPYDTYGAIQRFYKTVNPELVLVMETEIWPNFYHKASALNIPLLLINGRLSDRATERYKKIQHLFSQTVNKASFIGVRDKSDYKKFEMLGAETNKVSVTGNIKYDVELDDHVIEIAKKRKSVWGSSRKVILAASTHEGEDEVILDAFKQLLKKDDSLLLVIVPRHPERFDSTYDLCTSANEKALSVVRHSVLTYDEKVYEQKTHEQSANNDYNVIIGDSMGELQSWYACTDITFIGGSLIKHGGHNPLEALLFGVKTLSGKHVFNFEMIFAELSEQSLVEFVDAKNMESTLQAALNLSDDKVNEYQKNAKAFIQQKTGVLQRLMKEISTYL